jgi:ADP-ribose pyrophosphatase YjhB (NUDIX family)
MIFAASAKATGPADGCRSRNRVEGSRCYTGTVSLRPPARYCSICGHAITRQVPPGDSRERDCCLTCGAVHYVNPRLIVGTVPVLEDRVLLCRRAIQPRYGTWTLPAGFMEVGETAAQGALRETEEEAKAKVELGPLFSIIDVLSVDQVHIFYLARLLNQDFGPGHESLDVRLFREEEIPWDEIAFRTVAATLRLFFEDRARGSFGTHTREILSRPSPEGAAAKE